MSPYVSVIIPTLNRDRHLVATLRYFLEIDNYPVFQTIVIDQALCHTQETESFLSDHKDRFIHCRVCYQSLTRARNDGVTLSKGDIIIFVDDDVEPFAGFIEGHVSAYNDPTVA